MSRAKTGKSFPLDPTTQLEVGIFASEHPELSRPDIGKKFNCTAEQVRYAQKQYEAGKLQASERDEIPVGRVVDPLVSFEKVLRRAVGMLAADEKLTAGQYIPLAERVAQMLRAWQSMNLVGHLKTVDAEIIASIIRRFMPEAREAEIVRIYQEEKNRIGVLGS